MRNRNPQNRKAKNFKQAWIDLIKYLVPYIIPIIIALLLAVFGTILTILGPGKLEEMLEVIFSGISLTHIDVDMVKVASIGFTLIGFYVFSALFSYIQSFILATVTQKSSYKLRSEISEKINKLPLSYYDNTTHGEVLSRVTNDVDTIGMTLNNSISTLISAITMFIGSIILMATKNWQMTLTVISTSLIGFVIMGLIMSRSQKHFIAQQQTLGALNGHIEEVYSGHRVVKVYNAEKEVSKEFDKLNDELFNSGWKSQFFSGLMMPLMTFISNLSYIAIAIVGMSLILTKKIELKDIGIIVSFTVYARFFTQTLSQFAQVGNSLQSAAAASERVFEFLKEEELKDESKYELYLNPKNVLGKVEFKNVRFSYIEGIPIINNFSAISKPGQKIAIVGPTGAGKTTIVNLLMKFYEIDSGEIYIDDYPISKLKRENIHELFSMVLQDTWIFEGTIRENIVYNRKDVSDEELINATKQVGLHHYIMTLPNNYDAILDDKIKLSEGQKQLLTIARAMIKKSPMLILDEATSNVDTRTEKLIQHSMEVLMEGKTSFIIAHRLSTIKNADLILVMKDGDIIEQGNHDELMAANGFYKDLYNSQFEE